MCYLLSCRLKTALTRFIYSMAIQFCLSHQTVNGRNRPNDETEKWYKPAQMEYLYSQPSNVESKAICGLYAIPHHILPPIHMFWCPESFLDLLLLTKQGPDHSITGRAVVDWVVNSPNSHAEALTPNMTVFRDRVYKEEIKVDQGHPSGGRIQ